MANQNTNMPHCNWKKKLQINMQTETHQIHKEVPKKKKKHYFKEKFSLLFKVHNIITDLMIDLKYFFFFFRDSQNVYTNFENKIKHL